MKTKFFLFAMVAVFFAACKTNEPEQQNPGPSDVINPAPPYITIYGMITNEQQQPLANIKVIVDSTAFAFELEDVRDLIRYSSEDGTYHISFQDLYAQTTWPKEITVTAQDTLDIYESQTCTVPVTEKVRYPDAGPGYDHIRDAFATANFVLKKK